MKLTMAEVVQATGGTLIQGSLYETISGVSTDTRTLKKGDLFFALKGTRDGHGYLQDAFAKGAGGAVVSEVKNVTENVICVPDTLKALGDLASHWRARFSIPVVAITGSNGKTTTKDMMASVLGKKFRVLKTEGNFNNLIGLPLTIFRLNKGIEMLILEMGMNAPGEIARLAEIAAPEVGVITNIGHAHLQGLQTLEGVAHAKGELLEKLPQKGRAVLNADDPFLPVLKRLSRAPVTTFGQKTGAFRSRHIQMKGMAGSSFEVQLRGRTQPFSLKIPGRQNISNALASLAVGDFFGVSVAKMRQALASFRAPSQRMQTFKVKGVEVINDTYNANPDSMRAALRLLSEAGKIKRGRRTMAILGDMLELGSQARALHQELGREVAKLGIDILIAVGRWGKAVAQGAAHSHTRSFAFRTMEQLIRAWPVSSGQWPLAKGDLVLIKGSRGMKMERIMRKVA